MTISIVHGDLRGRGITVFPRRLYRDASPCRDQSSSLTRSTITIRNGVNGDVGAEEGEDLLAGFDQIDVAEDSPEDEVGEVHEVV